MTVPDVEFRVLGPLEVIVDGRALELKRRKQRSVLALLLLNAGEVVSTDRLVEEVWAGKPPKAAVGSLQNLISDLRKALGRDVVRTRQPGYVLDVDRERVDLHRFERLVAQAAEGGDAERRSTLLHEALAMWRGSPLADLAYEPFADVEIARLEELRTVAREELIQAELELGHHSQLVGELEMLVAEHPLRERLRGQLMLALYRSGRQAEALEAYRQAREALVEELGIEPSSDLQRLEQSILRHDSELDLVKTAAVEVWSGGDRRKTVTILFADIVNSTSLGAQLDPEVLRAIMRRYFDTVRTIVERHGGTVERFIGNAAMAVFGIPQVHEDDALRAVRTATELREALVGLNAELARDHMLVIQIRTGINTGEVLAGDAASGQPFATGAAVTLAMRLQQAAAPGETLLGEATHTLLRDVVTTEPLEASGADSALGEQAFRFVALEESSGLRRSTGARLVGRHEELALLQRVLESVVDERRSRVVVILGEAGIGKTRLTSEFVSSLGTEVEALVGRCVSYGEGATYLPLAEIVRQAAPQRAQATIAELLEGDEHSELIAERMAELTGQAGSTAHAGELFWAVRRFFEALAAKRPLVVVLEDIHWAEPTLLDLIEYLRAWTSEAPVLTLCIARPDLLQKRPGWGSSGETVPLQPLTGSETGILLAELPGAAELSDRARARIVEVAEGNALFVEQLLAHITDDADPKGLDDVVPPSIEALMASRLDRLEPEERAVLERSAVIGKDFTRSAVLHLSPPEAVATVDGRLAALEARGMIQARRLRQSQEDEFRFHHVLLREVAYAGITKELRADLHERHGSWLAQRNEADELVGYHAEQAHRYRGELWASDPELARLAAWAGERLAAAGIRAWKRADTPATINLLERAAGLLSRQRPEHAEVLCELGIAQRWSGDFGGAEKTLSEAIESAQDRRSELRARLEQAHVRLFSESVTNSDELLHIAAEAIPIFEEFGDDRSLGRAWRHVGYVRGGIQGRLADWREAAERALVHYRRSGWSASGCLAELGAALLHGPTPVDEALARCDELLELTTDRAGRANVMSFMGGLVALEDRFDEARRLLGEAAATYEEIGDTYALANNSGRVLGRVEQLSGDAASAERALRGCCATFEQIHDQAGLSTVAAELADALYALGRDEEAGGWIDLAQKCAADDDVNAQHTWRRVRAKLLARQGAFSEARPLAFEAARIVGDTDAINDHGTVLLDLAEVLRASGSPNDAAGYIHQAVGLFDRKQNIVSARAGRSLLSELPVP